MNYNKENSNKNRGHYSIGHFKGDFDLYRYANNNPLIYIDYEGRMAVITGVIIAAYAIGAFFVFKDCMERCTGIKFPRDLEKCPDRPDNYSECAELCFPWGQVGQVGTVLDLPFSKEVRHVIEKGEIVRLASVASGDGS